MPMFVEQGSKRIDLDDNDWVEIKSIMSIGDWERYEASFVQMVAEDAAAQGNREFRRRQRGTTSRELKMSAGYLELLEINLINWSAEQPLTRANIAELKPEVASQILDAIEGLNPDSPLAVANSYKATLDSNTDISLKENPSPSP